VAASCVFPSSAFADGKASDNTIGIRLLELPVNRKSDPRAQVYIVDHVAPGAVIKRHVLVSNNSRTTMRVDMFAGSASIDNNMFDARSGHATNELTSWISFDRNTLILAAGSSTRVLVTIAVDRIAYQGERYGVIWAETVAPVTMSTNVLMLNRVGVRIYLDIGAGGEPPSNFQITSLTPMRTADGRPEVVAAMRNTGGRALDIAGELSLSDGPGGSVAGPFPLAAGATVLPGHTARLRALLDKRLPNGPWRARLTVRSGALQRVVTATITFPSAAGTTGAPVIPESWLTTHLSMLSGLGVAIGLVLILSLLVRRRFATRARTTKAHRPGGLDPGR
jgi:hypothetical protein